MKELIEKLYKLYKEGFKQEITYTQFPCGINKGIRYNNTIVWTKTPKHEVSKIGTSVDEDHLTLYLPKMNYKTFEEVASVEKMVREYDWPFEYVRLDSDTTITIE